MIFLLQGTGQGENFFALNFLYVCYVNDIFIAENWSGHDLLCLRIFFFGLVQITFLLQSSGQSENFFTLNCLSGCKRYFITEYWAGQGLLDHPEIFVRM